MSNKSKIIAAAVKAATTARTGKMIADNDNPIAIAPIPICRALTHVGGFMSMILVLANMKIYVRLYLSNAIYT
jgi:hypothetical protein